MNETTIVYNSQKSGYFAKCWNITLKAIKTPGELGYVTGFFKDSVLIALWTCDFDNVIFIQR